MLCAFAELITCCRFIEMRFDNASPLYTCVYICVYVCTSLSARVHNDVTLSCSLDWGSYICCVCICVQCVRILALAVCKGLVCMCMRVCVCVCVCVMVSYKCLCVILLGCEIFVVLVPKVVKGVGSHQRSPFWLRPPLLSAQICHHHLHHPESRELWSPGQSDANAHYMHYYCMCICEHLAKSSTWLHTW